MALCLFVAAPNHENKLIFVLVCEDDEDIIIMMKKRTARHIMILTMMISSRWLWQWWYDQDLYDIDDMIKMFITMMIWSRCFWQWLMQNVHDHNINDNDWCRACNEIRKLTVLHQAILQCTTLWTFRQKFKYTFYYLFYYLLLFLLSIFYPTVGNWQHPKSE